MTTDPIPHRVNQVFAGVFADEGLVVDGATTSRDVPGWDSLNHATLIAEIERHFGIKFSLREVMRFHNVGDLCAVIRGRVGASAE